jgi:hypothetical protein
MWLPEVQAEAAPTPGVGEVVEGLPDAIVGDEVITGRWSLRALTEEELAARDVARAEAAEAQIDANLVRRVLRDQVMAGAPDDEVLADMAGLFPAWRPWVDYAQGDMLQHEGKTVRVAQSHTSQPGWDPLGTPALYQVLGDTDPDTGLAAWVQPAGAHDAYQIGDEVTHGGQSWRSTAANNVWEPGVYGWVVI